MKKLLLLSSVCILISTSSFGQGMFKKLAQKLEFGIKAGGNYSNFDGANFATDPLAGFHGGATVAFKVTDNFLIQQEFLFSMQGAKVLAGPLGAQEIKLSYLSVPILLKYRTNFGLFVEAGPQVGLKLKEEVTGFQDIDFAKKIDFGVAGGIGFQSKIGLGIGARYLYGIEKVMDKPNVALGDFKNNNIQASIFYTF
ncbi:porin family protein [Pedobacter sp. N23S346]|uniref:porin family protein n=1 Tax=Pedobacter sp. N23S346 TaxID=3402750 RepID=UPI003ACBDF66